MSYDELEIWLPVVGYEGLYEVSSRGQVRGFARLLANSQGIMRNWPARVLKPQPDSRGYTQVTLYCPNKGKKTLKIYRLVAEAFHTSQMKKGSEVNHIDGNKLNNTAQNLEWVTRLENSRHAWKNNLVPVRYGQETAGAKLTNAEVQQIRSRYRRYGKENSAVSLAKEFNVTRQAIADIIHNKTWRQI